MTAYATHRTPFRRLAWLVVALGASAGCAGDIGLSTITPGPEIGVTPASATIAVADSVKLTVSLPQTLAAAGATYVSANPAVARTQTNGWVIGVGRGNTNVVVTSIADPRLSTAVSISVTP